MPYPAHGTLRDAGPVIWIECYGEWARYKIECRVRRGMFVALASRHVIGAVVARPRLNV